MPDAKSNTAVSVAAVVGNQGVEACTLVEEQPSGEILRSIDIGAGAMCGGVVEYEAVLYRSQGVALAIYSAAFMFSTASDVVCNDAVLQVRTAEHAHSSTASVSSREVLDEAVSDGEAVPIYFIVCHVVGVRVERVGSPRFHCAFCDAHGMCHIVVAFSGWIAWYGEVGGGADIGHCQHTPAHSGAALAAVGERLVNGVAGGSGNLGGQMRHGVVVNKCGVGPEQNIILARNVFCQVQVRYPEFAAVWVIAAVLVACAVFSVVAVFAGYGVGVAAVRRFWICGANVAHAVLNAHLDDHIACS